MSPRVPVLDWITTARDALGRAAEAEAGEDPGPDPVAAPEPPEPAQSPYYVGEWRGGPLLRCPMCWGRVYFTARTEAAIVDHAKAAHGIGQHAESIEERAEQAGIILAHR